ncbi:hypothetical protein GQ44DRAFT_719161 [Phaeosphaeriaceae sp. PMI808]|nr:hypothetical protein GQ44DRAFT_719161 [Phaeosphaeriaceae sp. PMI808]
MDKDDIELHSEEDEPLLDEPHKTFPESDAAHHSRRNYILVQLLLLCLNGAWFLFNIRGRHYHLIHSPLNYLVHDRIEAWDLTHGKPSEYTSLNRTVADAAWDKVDFGPTRGWLKVQKSDLDKINDTSVPFADGSGYLAGIEVFSQLNCLNYLRKQLYNSTYQISPADETIPAQYRIPHCIEAIRLALQCQSDVTLITQRWADGWGAPMANWKRKHQCRNFDKILEYAQENQPIISGKLVHPKLGLVKTGRLNFSPFPIGREVHFLDNAE